MYERLKMREQNLAGQGSSSSAYKKKVERERT